MVVHVNIYGHMHAAGVAEHVCNMPSRCPCAVSPGSAPPSFNLLALTSAVNLEQKIAMIHLFTIRLIHYGMEVVILLAITVAPISTYHGSNIS